MFPLGDITNRNTPERWKNAQAAMRVLETARMPFCMVPGNHAYGRAKASKGDVHDGEQLWRELVAGYGDVIMPSEVRPLRGAAAGRHRPQSLQGL